MSNDNNKKPSTAKKLVMGYVSTVSGFGLLTTTIERFSGLFGIYGGVAKRLLRTKSQEAAGQSQVDMAKLADYQHRYRNAQRTAYVSAAFLGYSLWVMLGGVATLSNFIWSLGCAAVTIAMYLVAVKELCAFRLSMRIRKKTFLTWADFFNEVSSNPANILPLSNKNKKERT